MRVQQFQCVGNAACARVLESRGFHLMATSPAGCTAIFCEIRRGPSKVKFVYRAIISVSFDFRTCYDGSNEAQPHRHSGRGHWLRAKRGLRTRNPEAAPDFWIPGTREGRVPE